MERSQDDGARTAFAQHGHYRYLDGLSILEYLQAQDPALSPDRRVELLASSAAIALDSIARAPMKPAAWLRVAVARNSMGQPPATVTPPLLMSVYTGRTHSTLLVPRVGIALPYLEFMDAETRSMLRDQLLLAWELKPNDLLRELRVRDRRLELTRELLGAGAAAILTEMEERLEKIR